MSIGYLTCIRSLIERMVIVSDPDLRRLLYEITCELITAFKEDCEAELEVTKESIKS